MDSVLTMVGEVNGDIRYIASRNAADSGFENAFTLARLANGGALKILGTSSSTFTGGLEAYRG